MKAIRIALLGLFLAAGLVSGSQAHQPRVGVSIQLGYPAYVAPPVYYAPPPPVFYVPPPPRVYLPPPFVVSPYGPRYYYDYDRGPHRGWGRHGGHHRH